MLQNKPTVQGVPEIASWLRERVKAYAQQWMDSYLALSTEEAPYRNFQEYLQQEARKLIAAEGLLALMEGNRLPMNPGELQSTFDLPR